MDFMARYPRIKPYCFLSPEQLARKTDIPIRTVQLSRRKPIKHHYLTKSEFFLDSIHGHGWFIGGPPLHNDGKCHFSKQNWLSD